MKTSIRTGSATGCIVRQLFHGRPRFVFVENANGKQDRKVFRVARDGDGWKPTGQVMDWQDGGDNDDPMVITAEYLAKTEKW